MCAPMSDPSDMSDESDLSDLPRKLTWERGLGVRGKGERGEAPLPLPPQVLCPLPRKHSQQILGRSSPVGLGSMVCAPISLVMMTLPAFSPVTLPMMAALAE